MKKILSSICVIFLSIALIPLKIFATSDTSYFIVTTYYSPLPNQKYYYTGDYESEIKLN
ncbi:MAG: hypothetical protein LBU14_00285 [Candidatus Peribacteria bacterium]|jgi:hypothetical protein|nr:hypothetical protein [Candidatus Peribacteria bacterium]